ncbi:hypothetical protein [Planctellipticum variicoloris]|uniref:hypothetical protein n=1 Tax=Planctellipticum variicoloris TaxID=3064265 RepID=UPI003013AAD1|nr:hypothetical protein SH412_003339 [Planctomycetaceae bacterium SH412]
MFPFLGNVMFVWFRLLIGVLRAAVTSEARSAVFSDDVSSRSVGMTRPVSSRRPSARGQPAPPGGLRIGLAFRDVSGQPGFPGQPCWFPV